MSDSPLIDEALPPPAPTEARYFWAVVTQSSPLRIRPDGDRVALGITPDDLGGTPRPVGQRVYCQILSRRLVVFGPAPAGSALPVGSVIATAGTLQPGFLWCAGQAVSRTTYASLFAALGTTYGVGDNTTTFNVPNLVGRVIVMQDPEQPEFDTLGEVGGAKTHTLSTSEMPAHKHGLNSGIVMPFGAPGSTSAPTATGGSYGFHYLSNPASAAMENAGGGTAHNNLQPYTVLNYMIRA